MNLSHYFEDLSKAYRAEIEDLQTDSEGNNVLNARLKEKRAQFSLLMPMIEFAPEMVAPAFYGGISFTNPHALTMLSFVEPEEFPSWDELVHAVQFEAWAAKLVETALNQAGGERFMITTICLEFLHGKHASKHVDKQDASDHDGDGESDADEKNENQDEGNDEDERDLEEAGADWMAEQGFDRRE